MCTNPHRMRNPNYGSNNEITKALKDTKSLYLEIPCGHCGECIAVRQASYVQRCDLEAMTGYPFFCTLTYQNKYLPEYVVNDDFSVYYSDIEDVRNMIKRLRKDNSFGRPFRYFGVTELGSKRARPHVHILFFVQRYPDDNVYTPVNLEKVLYKEVLEHWQRNIAKCVDKKGKIVPNTRSPQYVNLCKFVARWYGGKLHSTYDLHYVVPSPNGDSVDVGFYVTKYMLKDSEQLDKIKSKLYFVLPEDEFDKVWKVVRTRHFQSLNFGFGTYEYQTLKHKDHKLLLLQSTEQYEKVKECIIHSLDNNDKPRFYDMSSGKPIPLSRYFYQFPNLYDLETAKEFRSRADTLDGVVIDKRNYDEKLRSELDGERKKHLVQQKITFFDYM